MSKPDKINKLINEVKEEAKYIRKTGIPRCHICKVDMRNAIDGVTGKVSKYL